MENHSQKSGKIKLFLLFAALVLIAGWSGYYIVTQGSPEVGAPVAQQQAVIIEEPAPFKIEEKVFGYSVAGKEIKGYVIGNGPNGVLLFAAQHGDEMGTAKLLEQLVLEIRASSSIVSQNKTLIILPINNPDGYYDRTDKLNANGVNLNLNFGTSDWQTRGPEGTFAGKEAFSEPESRVIKDIVEIYKPSAMISFHSQGAVVSPETSQASIKLAEWYAEKTGYEYYVFWDYPGTATKWFEQAMGKAAITVETKDNLKADWEANKPALLELISAD